MKKWGIFPTAFALIFFPGCGEELVPIDVTIKNSCDFSIEVNLCESNDISEEYYVVKKNEGFTFENIPRGNYYILIKKTPTERFISPKRFFFDKPVTFTIKWELFKDPENPSGVYNGFVVYYNGLIRQPGWLSRRIR